MLTWQHPEKFRIRLFALAGYEGIIAVMKIVPLIKKIPIPVILLSGLYVGYSGEIPLVEMPLDDFLAALGMDGNLASLLASLDVFLYENTKQPIILVFLLGLFVAWVLYQIVVLGYGRRRMKARLKLVEVRDDGVNLRLRGVALSEESEVDPWIYEINDWHARALKTIAKIDKADAGQFNTIDFPKIPRGDLPRYLNDDHRHFYIMIDNHLVRLDEYMTNYGERFNNGAV